MPTKIVLDGTMPSGSRTITVNAVLYKMNNFNVTPATEKATDNNTDGTPGRIRATAGIRTWSGELQLASFTTARPQLGDTFTATYDATYGAETYAFDGVPYEEDNSPTAIRVIKATGWVVLNPGNYSVVT